MVQLVRDDEVFFAQNRRDRPGIRRESRLENHTGFDVLEACNLLLKLHVNLHRACDGADCTRAHSVLARGLESSFAQFGMRGQAQIIVGGKIDDLLAVERADRRLFVVEHAQLEVRALSFEVVQLVAQVRQRISTRGCNCHRKILATDQHDLHGSELRSNAELLSHQI